MSIPISPFNTRRPTPVERFGLYAALVFAHCVSHIKPAVLHKLLKRYADFVDLVGWRSVTRSRAEHAHAALCHISPRSASHDACFVRSLTLFLYLRFLGRNISWHAGFRTDPFLAHAWVQIGDHPVSEAIEVSDLIETLRVA